MYLVQMLYGDQRLDQEFYQEVNTGEHVCSKGQNVDAALILKGHIKVLEQLSMVLI